MNTKHMHNFVGFNHTAIPMVCLEGWNGVQTLSFEMLKYLHRTSVLALDDDPSSLNPETLHPKP